MGLADIVAAIKSMQKGEMAGPDGYSTDFYEKCADKLSPVLLNMFHDLV